MEPQNNLEKIAEQLKRGEDPSPVTVRTLLAWFEAQRRGVYIIARIRDALAQLDLRTEPDFESTYIDGEINFRSASMPVIGKPSGGRELTNLAEDEVDDDGSLASRVGGVVDETTYRIGRLESANRTPISVKPDAKLSECVTLMLAHDFSQIPVMQSEYNVKGMINWASIGSRLALGIRCKVASDCMDEAREISSEESLFDAIGRIVKHQYLLVRSPHNKIVGIVTTSDLSLHFQQLAEPFLLIGEIENHIRSLLLDKFTVEQISSVQDPTDRREISNVAHMTFNHYIQVLRKRELWDVLGLELDQSVFTDKLGRVRDLRNDVMHFDSDPLGNDLDFLREFARFMQNLKRIGVLDGTQKT